MTTFAAETPLKPTAFTRLRAGIPGAMLAEFFGTFVVLLLGLGTCAVAGILLYDFFIGHVLDARAAMLRTPEPGLAPLPTTNAASGVAGPVTAEESADAEDLREDQAA